LVIERGRPEEKQRRKLRAIAMVGGIAVGVVLLLWPTPPLTRPGGLVWIAAGWIASWVMGAFPYLRVLGLKERGERATEVETLLAGGPGRVVDWIVVPVLVAAVAAYMVGPPAARMVAFFTGWLIMLLGLGATVMQLALYLPRRRPSAPWAGRAWGASFGVVFGIGWVGWPIPDEANRWLAAGWLMIGFSLGVAAWVVFLGEAVRKVWEGPAPSMGDSGDLTED